MVFAGGGAHHHLGTEAIAHDLVTNVHAQPMKRVLWEHDEIHRAEVTPGLADELHHTRSLPRQIIPGLHYGQLELHKADHYAVL